MFVSTNFTLKETQSDIIVSCSVGITNDEWPQIVFNEEGAVLGPTGEWELDPQTTWHQCSLPRPVFAVMLPEPELPLELLLLSELAVLLLSWEVWDWWELLELPE